ncbi:MAG: class I SAM-dependent methyltransferase [Lachnospiraceae bacterium]|jgi:SAM-dependent methyltransferase
MDKIKDFLETYMDAALHQIVISGARRQGGISKIKVRPVLLKGDIWYQVTETAGSKELHKNYKKEELIPYLCIQMKQEFKQLQLETDRIRGTVLVSKKGRVTVHCKKQEKQEAVSMRPLSHNRKKRYLLEEGKPVPFLIELGVMNREGKVLAPKYDKFKQLNRFLEFIEDILPRLPKDREVTILDFGCGKSYLTFAMYHYLRELKGYDVKIIGLDLKQDVIETCSRLAEQFGYEKLHFYQGDIAYYEGVDHVDMVVTLHACDTATDYALAKAVRWGAQVILSVPCCQHELNKQISNELLSPIFSYGILKERFAALLTDGLRAKMLEEQGYEVQILEFIDMEHTPKNLLIRAVRQQVTEKGRKEAFPYRASMEFFHADPTLAKLLQSEGDQKDEESFN